MKTRDPLRSTWMVDDLASSRQHILRHPKTVIYSMASDDTKITPVWAKVGQTPWGGRKSLTGGYGRTLGNTSISDDVPTYFTNPEHHPSRQMIRHTQQLKVIPRHESSHVLPGGRSLIKFKERQQDEGMYRGAHRKFPNGNETVIDVLPTARHAVTSNPIQWGPLPAQGPKEYFPAH